VPGSPIPLLSESAEGRGSLLASLAAHLGFGFALFYGVQKFFEEVEKKLSTETKLEVAVWLLDLRPTKAIHGWYSTFPKIFDRVFGDKHFSWKCFWRSCAVTAVATLAAQVPYILFSEDTRVPFAGWGTLLFIFTSAVFGNIFPDFISLWKTRYLLNLSSRGKGMPLNILFLIIDIIATLALATCAALLGTTFFVCWAVAMNGPVPIAFAVQKTWSFFLESFFEPKELAGPTSTLWLIPAFIGRLWLVMYVGCGLLLIAARRLDIGFAWFNRHFDVAEHPLQCIGLVAGAISALGYWALAAVHLLP
jgi:hypothetical protein